MTQYRITLKTEPLRISPDSPLGPIQWIDTFDSTRIDEAAREGIYRFSRSPEAKYRFISLLVEEVLLECKHINFICSDSDSPGWSYCPDCNENIPLTIAFNNLAAAMRERLEK